MYEYLKKLFPDGAALTFDQLVEALQSDKSVKLANLSDGGFVAKEKYDAQVTKTNGLQEQLDAANTEIQSYKDMDIEGIKKSASDWETKYNADTKALNDKLTAQARSFATKRYLDGYQFSDDLVREAIDAKFNAKEFKLSEDGKFEGADTYMEELKKAYPKSFVSATDPAGEPSGNEPSGAAGTPGGNPPADPPTGGQPAKKTPWFAPQKPPAFAGGQKRTLSEMMKYKNEHPEATVKLD